MRGLSIVLLGCVLAGCTQSAAANDMGANDLAVSNPPYTCPQLSNYCDHALPWAPCAATLADARSSYCVPDAGVRAGGPHAVLTADCGTFRMLYAGGVDGGESFYYDTASGMLVAVIGDSANFGGSMGCDGGPATFTPPHCQPSLSFCD